ncbi:MAG: PKD domain-containing protein [Dissulfurispiraceae bacterium]
MKRANALFLRTLLITAGVLGLFLLKMPLDSLGAASQNDSGVLRTKASFHWTPDASASYKIKFDAAASTCAAEPCAYSWDFGDGSAAGTLPIVAHAYADGATHKVTLKVTDAWGVTQASSRLVAGVVNLPPSIASSVTVKNYTVNLIDASSDDRMPPRDAVTVNWNDGGFSRGDAGNTFTHTYASASTYNILHTITDASGVSVSEVQKVSVPERFSISGRVTKDDGKSLAGATVVLKFNETAKAVATTSDAGNFRFDDVLPGTYLVQAYKSEFSFHADSRQGAPQNPVRVSVGPNKTVNFVAVPDASQKGSPCPCPTMPTAEAINRMLKDCSCGVK